MKVRELIEALTECDPDALVVMSKDGEGNNFSPLADCNDTHYSAYDTYSGECRRDSDVDTVAAVCLWPVN